MEKYDYRRHITDDIKSWLEYNNTLEDFTGDIYEYLDGELWSLDCITGNGAFFYDSEERCTEYLSSNFDLALQACDELMVDIASLRLHSKLGSMARYIDCTIRCYLLDECIYKALEELGYEKV